MHGPMNIKLKCNYMVRGTIFFYSLKRTD